MWKLIIFVYCISWVEAQYSRQHGPTAWNIMLAVPGSPGNDYPTLATIPRTSFSCAGKVPGYYGDTQTNCQVFRVCTAGSTYGFQSFLCPNGTLFNQAVFVCDWWMNVNCRKTPELITNNNDRFARIKFGPQLMKDVRKMITYPTRNPYDKAKLKSNTIVMQEYKPPSGQYYPNGVLISSQQSNKLNTQNILLNQKLELNDLNIASTTPPRIGIPYANQYTQKAQFQNYYNHFSRPQSFHKSNFRQPKQSDIENNLNSHFRLTNTQNSNRKIHQDTKQFEQIKLGDIAKQTEYDFKRIKIQGRDTPLSQVNTEVKNNLVSTPSPTILSKTIAIKRIIEGKEPGTHKSRITFKTWILKPKNSKLIIDTTSYPQSIPASVSEKLVSSGSSYVYNKPTEKISTEEEIDKPYYYEPPSTVSNKIINTGNQISSLYGAPVTFRPTISSRLNLTPPKTDIVTTELFLSPTTYKPSNYYIPPTASQQVSRQYLTPNIASQQTQGQQNAKLVSSTTLQEPEIDIFEIDRNQIPSYTVTKHSRVNTNHNNLSFTDILTKEKIDITVNNIIKDTSKILVTASPSQVEQLENIQDFTNENSLDGYVGSKELLSSDLPIVSKKLSKIIASPSLELQPPSEDGNYKRTKNLINLPYYKEPINTIERTVSLKITIPEKIANYLFKNQSQNYVDASEILNTGSSNYLVFANNLASGSDSKFIPIGKLRLNKDSDISNSQDLVFSFLADSLNAATQYGNIAQKNIPLKTTQTNDVQNLREGDAQKIISKITQLTSSQFTNNNALNHNIRHQQSSALNQQSQTSNQITQQTRQLPNNEQNNYRSQKLQQSSTPLQPVNADYFQSTRLKIPKKNNKVRDEQSQIYSGQLYQLPVPIVTKEYYNSPNQCTSCQTNELGNKNQLQKQSDADTDIARLQNIPINTLKNVQSSNQFTDKLTQSNYNLINSDNSITTHLQDTISGTLRHPSQSGKLVTYKKDQSYYLYSQLNDENENNHLGEVKTNDVNVLQLDNEQERITSNDNVLPNSINREYQKPTKQDINNEYYSINLPQFDKIRLGKVSKLYDGPSSYITPQLTVFDIDQSNGIRNINSRIEDLDDDNNNDNNGYPKIIPQRPFNS